MNLRPSLHQFILVLAAGSLIFSSSSCTKKNDNQLPKLLVASNVITVAEDDASGKISVNIYFSVASGKEGSFDYRTSDSTATAGVDYEARTGETVTFKAGETGKVITVNLMPNTTRINDVWFTIKLENPVNCTLTEGTLKVKIKNTDYKTLVWVEDFTSSPLNDNIWNYETGGGGWGNNELQTYTNKSENVHIDSGYLHLTALNPVADYYTSGRITTKGKKEFTNCRVEIRAKLPEGKGLWPALWMIGANISSIGWPGCGEIDIMEYLGHQPSTSYGAVHWNRNGHTYFTGTYNLPSGKFSDSFHIFSLEWTPNNIRWYVDDNLFFSKSKVEVSGFPMELPQFFVFNVAVGGNWPGSPDATTTFPQHMIVDYIKVYQ